VRRVRQLTSYRLWLGNVLDARDLRGIHDQRIQAIVDLAANEPPPTITRDLAYMRYPLLDSTGNPPWMVCLAVEAVWRLLHGNVPTLVYCSAGMSRTPAIVAAALALETNRSLADCLQAITADAPHDVSPGLIADVQSALPFFSTTRS
jgi:protein-tyrosine phosphatase